MKVKFKYGIKTYSGKVDNMVYGSYRHDQLCISRDFVYPTLTENNHTRGAIIKNLAVVYHAANADYLIDLKTYCFRNGQENTARDALIPTMFSMFMKLMYAWHASDPTHVDLATVTVADIVTGDADVRTIARAVGADFLPVISVYDDLTADIQ